MKFHDGQSVICVKGYEASVPERLFSGVTWPVKGRRYTVRHYVPGTINHKIKCLLLCEIRNNPIVQYPGFRYEAGFWEERFEAATDISDLQKIATDVELFIGPPPQFVVTKEEEDA